MGWDENSVSQAVAIAGCAALAATVLMGVVGAVWRLTFWQMMHGQGLSENALVGPGFEWGFGLPFVTVVVWAVLFGVVLAVVFLLYQRLVGAPDARVGDIIERGDR